MGDADETLAGDTLPTPPPADPGSLGRGEKVGRYVVLERVGAGAMGVVLAAYDPELDRRIALKLLKPRGGSSGSTGKTRLQREAQALAKLSHRNVVSVFDVGTHGEHVYVAMEFVDGQTLGAWADERHPWKKVVQVYVEAGRGLAACHEAGLVHRDFKPDNVMLDGKGRVRVMDFGLARGEQDVTGTPLVERLQDTKATPGHDALSTPLTQTGAVMGTPAYMSPEQFAGLGADARSDQFGYCVALYEALYGERPFAGETMAALSLAVTRGKVQEAPRGSVVPKWVRAVVLRGLESEPEKRWPDMRSLVEALGKDPAVRRNQWLAFGGAVVLIGGMFGGMWAMTRAEQEDCEAAAAAIEEVWNEDRKAAVVAAIGQALPEGKDDPSKAVVEALDGYAGEWAEMERGSCDSGQAGEAPTGSDRALVRVCLTRRRMAASALLTVLENADENVAMRADKLAEHLPELAACNDEEALRREVPAPDDPGVLSQVLRLEERLETARMLGSASREKDALQDVAAVLSEAEGLGYPPLVAQALYGRFVLERQLRDRAAALATSGELFELAVMHGLTEKAAESAAARAELLAATEEDWPSAAPWLEVATAHARAVGDDRLLARVLANTTFVIPVAERAEYHDRAIDAVARAYGEQASGLRKVLYNAAVFAQTHGRPREAEAYLLRALRSTEASGIDPTTPLVNLSEMARARRDYDAAREYAQRALKIQEEKRGRNDHRLCDSLNRLANVEMMTDSWQAARDLAERCLRLADGALAPDHLRLLNPRLVVAASAWELGDVDGTAEQIQIILGSDTAANNPTMYEVLESLILQARVELKKGELERAAALIQDVRARSRKVDDTLRGYIEGQYAMFLWDLPPRLGGGPKHATDALLGAVQWCREHACQPEDYETLADWADEHGVEIPAPGEEKSD